jgi:hypothetical protein
MGTDGLLETILLPMRPRTFSTLATNVQCFRPIIAKHSC